MRLSEKGGLKSLTQLQFSQILRALHPKHFSDSTLSYDMREFITRIERVKDDMQNCGFLLKHFEWGHILDCGRAAMDWRKTQKWWAEMVKSGIQPDVWSYNNYLHALCGSASKLQFERSERYKLTDDGTLISLGKSVSKSMRTHQRFPIKGTSKFAKAVVDEMTAKKVQPNTYTYEILMTSYARDGDLDAVNDIVRRIWGFESDGTLAKATPKARVGSTLFPTEQTLIVLANAYGYNGALAAATTLIDAFSLKYDISIPVGAWLSLLTWASRRSTIHKRPRMGFISPLAAPRLFKVMTSEPYNISPGIEAYWLMVNHELKRRAFGSPERLLVDALKRYGPNGIDLTPNTQHLANITLIGVKNWVPIICDKLSRGGYRDRALAMFRRWQQRFESLEKTGLLRQWDEVPESMKSKVPGILLPPSPTTEPTSYAIRKQLARLSQRPRKLRYERTQELRRQHYPSRWKGAGRPLFLPFGINIQYGLGSPSRYFRKPHALWQKHVQGSFANPGARRLAKVRKRARAWKKRCLLPQNYVLEEKKRIMGLKSGYHVMNRERAYVKKQGYRFKKRERSLEQFKKMISAKATERAQRKQRIMNAAEKVEFRSATRNSRLEKKIPKTEHEIRTLYDQILSRSSKTSESSKNVQV